MPMDAYRKADVVLVEIDLPGVDGDAIELTVEDDVLTVRAERLSPEVQEGVEAIVAERPYGTFSRQMFLGDNLDVDRIEAHYQLGCSPAPPRSRRTPSLGASRCPRNRSER